ncbi:hypothetical protein CANCADRAFT_29190 [Tortispora caseinolytica NRRL Y-17796]|uniref:FCP1 homology domain-containing protein n=1 Tax=Tortispora caseinolytica NRRL Y-17796 TaxID=767744 RepID=A0A1E4TDD1_9ASCO|nr:hypothetical protein CANCADRAFT_29190 [Tortispora caseinolytica NRRL Y-17796]
MVEVKLDRQLAILYSVHKRPHCDEFLRAVHSWYNLVVFTASVKAYADPVIDFLEQDQRYFTNRFYRNHCTPRGGGYIKNLSLVSDDLTQAIIIDNSPISYADHVDNAIAIEGWINDPGDKELLYLLPLLNAMRYMHDVRSLISLRAAQHITELF